LEIQKWYSDNLSRKIHPIELGAIFHHKFECIHPFQDGNGRVGRAILDFMLKSSGFPPIYIPVEERSRYLDVLAEADLNNYIPLIDFLICRMLFTMTLLFSKTSLFYGINSSDFQQFTTNYLGDDRIHAIIIDQFIQYRKSTKLP
jgi:Fic/DOC family